MKQLLNRIQSTHNGTQTLIVALQETHIENNNLKYCWRGNNVFTAGSGNKGGIITLLSDNIKVIDEVSLGTEAHVCVLQIIENNHSMCVVMSNIHAPCAHGQAKLNFFKQ